MPSTLRVQSFISLPTYDFPSSVFFFFRHFPYATSIACHTVCYSFCMQFSVLSNCFTLPTLASLASPSRLLLILLLFRIWKIFKQRQRQQGHGPKQRLWSFYWCCLNLNDVVKLYAQKYAAEEELEGRPGGGTRSRVKKKKPENSFRHFFLRIYWHLFAIFLCAVCLAVPECVWEGVPECACVCVCFACL